MRHTIERIHFLRGTSDGDCECSCGWYGLASEFGWHRKAAGAPSADVSQGLGPKTVTPHEWNNSGRISECRHGHLMTPDNIYIAPRTRYRGCVACRRERAAEYNARLKAERATRQAA